MKKYIAGFIGAGNMGGAIAGKLCEQVGAKNVIITCSTKENSQKTATKFGCDFGEVSDVIKNSKFVFLAIKPQNANDILSEFSDLFCDEEITVVTMLAGKTIDFVSKVTKTKNIIRIMPNTPVSVGAGMTQIAFSNEVKQETRDAFCKLISVTGKCDIVLESQIDVACALSGCGPAFVYMFIEALSDGAVKCGLPRDKATQYAAQTILGAAKLLIETQKSTSELKNAVCSPGGSTIAGVSSLENDGFRSAAINAVCAAYKRTKELSEK